MDTPKQKLKKTLKNKREARNGASASSSASAVLDAFGEEGSPDILKMMDSVNKLLKTNPQMLEQISKCVSNVMNNKDLIGSLKDQLK